MLMILWGCKRPGLHQKGLLCDTKKVKPQRVIYQLAAAQSNMTIICAGISVGSEGETWVRLIIDYFTEPGFCHWDIKIRTENVNMYFHMLFFSTFNQAIIQRTYQKASTHFCIYNAGLYCKGCTSPVSCKSVGSLQGQSPRHVVTTAPVRVFYYVSHPNITHNYWSFITEQFNSNTAKVSIWW